jgi:hypothetical protein
VVLTECVGADFDSINPEASFEDLRIFRGDGDDLVACQFLELPGGPV